jgi:rfaE bifunctional protein kinase chain/domain
MNTNISNLRHSKTIDACDLPLIIAECKAKGNRVVLCHGAYDILHSAHIRLLLDASQQADVLVVLVTADRQVEKGTTRRLVFSAKQRAETVAAIQDVDYVAISDWSNAAEAIRSLRPDVFVQTTIDREEHDIARENEAEAQAIREIGGRIHRSGTTSLSSLRSSDNIFSQFPAEVEEFLTEFRRHYDAADVLRTIDQFGELKVLVVGEAILDEYVYGDTLGKSAKEPMLALKYVSQEVHAGGSVVIANHLADLCQKIFLLTYLGQQSTREDFIRQSLKPSVFPEFILKSRSPTIVKRRFVERYLVSKLFEVYEMNDEPLAREEENLLCSALEELLPEVDVAIVADYGHGLITPKVIEVLCSQSRFLAVNTQINAANNGYHTISRYPRADYVCVHEGEIRLDQRDRWSDLRSLVTALSKRLRCRQVMVTQGKHGTLLYSEKEGFSYCPAFAMKIVDRVGAGDSVLAVSSLCAAQALPAELTGFIANMVGAQAVTIVGNRSAIDKKELLMGIEVVLK